MESNYQRNADFASFATIRSVGRGVLLKPVTLEDGETGKFRESFVGFRKPAQDVDKFMLSFHSTGVNALRAETSRKEGGRHCTRGAL
ncbi:MAG: hypothetical protein WBD36_05855 [Bacteroidota bacterium]